jgi:hypothetical protein
VKHGPMLRTDSANIFFYLTKTAVKYPGLLALSVNKSVARLLCYHVIYCNITKEEKSFHTNKVQ